MSGIETSLQQTLAERAHRAGPVGFTTDDILRRGRRARARRRALAVAASATAVVAIAVATVTALPSGQAGPNNQPAGTPTPTPTPSTPSTLAPATVDYAVGTTLVPRSGEQFTVPLPADATITDAAKVPGGWLVEAEVLEPPAFRLWWRADDGTVREIGQVAGSWQVSADGSVLVVDGLPAGTTTAYELPSLGIIAETAAFSDSTGPVVLGTTNTLALIRSATGDGSPTIAGVWELTTNTLRTTTVPVNVAPARDTPRVLVRFADGCVDVVDLAEVPDAQPGGTCVGLTTHGGWLSPDGGTALISADTGTSSVRAADLRAGVWDPVETTAAGLRFSGWEAGRTSFFTSTLEPPQDGQPDIRYQRCTSLTSCVPIDLPAGARPLVGR